MRVVVTGASGFLGSWICRVLSEDHEVYALVREGSSLLRLSNINQLQVVRLNTELWADYICSSTADVLILNDWDGVGSEYRNENSQFLNVKRLTDLASAGSFSGFNTIIGVGSQAELGQVDWEILESEPDSPTTSYGHAKVLTRMGIISELKGHSTRFVWMRIFSTYGPLDEGSWLIPNMVGSLTNDRRFKMTKGEQVWSYLHAYDLASAFNVIVNSPDVSGIVNVGNPKSIAISDVGIKIAKILDKEDLIDYGAEEYRVDQVMKLQPKCETLNGLGWSPRIDFDDGLKQTIDWLQGKKLKPLPTLDGERLNFKIPSRE